MKQTNTILDKILRDKELEVQLAKKKKSLSVLKQSLSERKTEIRDFHKAMGAPGKLHVMAEIKKASPSAGLIKPDFDHIAIAKEYEASKKVDAISILTESKYFQGNLSFIKEIKPVTSIPLFRKDFIFDEYQIYESYLSEADALLLIAAALEPEQLKRLLDITRTLGMNALVETHSSEEIDQALQAGGQIIGINARDLKTFILDKELFSQLAYKIPSDKVKIAESGLESKEEVKEVYDKGANAVLIGSSIMKSNDIQHKIAELISLV